MALTTSTITGRVPMPDDTAAKAAELIFRLSALDTEGADVLPPGATVRRVLLVDGAIPDGFALWRNTEGYAGSHYVVTARWTEMDRRSGQTAREEPLGNIQVGDEASYTLADLLLHGITPAVPSYWVSAAAGDVEAVINAANALSGFTEPGYLAEVEAGASAAGVAAGQAGADADRAEAAAEAAADAVQYDYLWDDDAARIAQTGMTADQRGYVRATEHVWRYSGSAWVDEGPSPTANKADKSALSAVDASVQAVTQKVSVSVAGVGARRGIVPMLYGRLGRIVQWWDQRLGLVRVEGDGLEGRAIRRGGWQMPILDAAGGIVGGMGPDGEWYMPAAVSAPMAYPQSDQAYLADGVAERALSIFESPVRAARVAAPGLVRAACADGSIRHASYRGRGIEGQDNTIRAILVMGQSLAVGGVQDAPTAYLAAAPSPDVLMWSQGLIPAGPGATADLGSDIILDTLVPAREAVAGSNFGETGIVSLAWALNGPSGRAGGSRYHVVGTGRGNTSYSGLKKGTRPYTNALASMSALRDWCSANARTLVLEAIIWDHAENNSRSVGGDTSADTASTYAGHMTELLADLTADLVSLAIPNAAYCPMLVMQRGCFNGGALAGPSLAMANASGRIVCVGPQYQHDFGDLWHPTSQSYRARSALYAEALRTLTQGGVDRWRPLRMTEAKIIGQYGEVRFDVSHPPIRLDDSLVSDPGCFGLSYTDSGDNPHILPGSVRVVAPDTLAFELSAAGSGTKRVRVAWHGGTNTAQGRTSGPRSCIHDSYQAACPASGRLIHNYALHQEIIA